MYIGIHNHTDMGSNLRFRDSTNKVTELIRYAHDIGHSGICITDHESVTAHQVALQYFHKMANEPEWEKFKLGLGNEIYLCTRDVNAEEVSSESRFSHFILLALDAVGHKAIRELSTHSWCHNAFLYYHYRVPTYYDELEELLKEYKGHLIGSSACLGGNLAYWILQYHANPIDDLWDAVIGWCQYMDELFGHGYFFLEMQPGTTEEQTIVNQTITRISEELDIPYIVTTDAHYLTAEDRPIHEAFLKAETDDHEREVGDFYATTYVMSEQELHSFMDESLGAEVVNTAINNTQMIYDKLEDYSLDKPLKMPYIPQDLTEPSEVLFDKYKTKLKLLSYFFESEYDSDRHMIREVLNGIERNPHYQTPDGYAAVDECLMYLKTSSEKMNVRWSAYLMQVRDYVRLAWESGTLVGPARGSGAGFCILYLLDIIQVDPFRETTKTYPWRFLNPERASVLDIDTDIESNARDTVINHFKEVYGSERAVKVMTLSTEAARKAILTAARGLDISNDVASYIASLIVADRGITRNLHQMYYGDPENDMKPNAEFKSEMDKYPELWKTAQKIEGLVCGVGQHAGGVVIVDEPITNSAALMRTKSGDVITQFDLHKLEDMSLIKIDLLCIDALDKIHACLNLLLKYGVIKWQGSLKATYEKYIGVYNCIREDDNMWSLLWNHKVISAFQMEKESGKAALALIKPHSVDDLATINSVIRLMAQEKGAEPPLQKYARFHDDIKAWYREMDEAGLTLEEQDILKEILGVSCGICEAQEFLFLLTMHPKIGGFSLAWADKLRKSVAKKNPEQFLVLQNEFFENAKKKNLSTNLTNYVWNTLIMTQRGYGFHQLNKTN